jgi:hypothetical protein
MAWIGFQAGRKKARFEASFFDWYLFVTSE